MCERGKVPRGQAATGFGEPIMMRPSTSSIPVRTHAEPCRVQSVAPAPAQYHCNCQFSRRPPARPSPLPLCSRTHARARHFCHCTHAIYSRLAAPSHASLPFSSIRLLNLTVHSTLVLTHQTSHIQNAVQDSCPRPCRRRRRQRPELRLVGYLLRRLLGLQHLGLRLH